MAQVAQAYFHFQTTLSAGELRKFWRQVGNASRTAAARNFDIDVRVSVDIEEGSVKGGVTALGILVVGIGLVANYKGVKDSIQEMCADARAFGADVCEKAVELAGISKRQVYRIEGRTKTTGNWGAC
jgi:hypothetical protein